MKPEQILQKMIDEASSMYSMGEESNIFNQKQKKAEEILKNMGKEFQQFQLQPMQFNYKSIPELNRMSVDELQNELHAIQEYNLKLQQEIKKLKNAEELTSFLIHEKNKTNTENGNSKQVNQIRKRGNNNASKN